MTAPFHEFAFIDWLRARTPAHPRLAVGIGDDAAVLRFPDPADCVVTVDMLMEGVHFTMPPASPRDVGRKALAVNLSDVAAMAARPLAAFVSVALPKHRDSDTARELHLGLQELADRYGVVIAGGDTNAWDGPLVVSVTVVGEATSRGVVRRSGAKPGDWILVTGSLGGSLAGKHLAFDPRVDEALRLHETADLHAMIDISDGLSADLHHILDESHVGAVLYADAIPISPAAHAMPDDQSMLGDRPLSAARTPLDRALSDGEDFELLFTLPAATAQHLLAHPPISVPLTHIGEITPTPGCVLLDAAGQRTPLPPRGWVHGV